jgi:hypothetical protein
LVFIGFENSLPAKLEDTYSVEESDSTVPRDKYRSEPADNHRSHSSGPEDSPFRATVVPPSGAGKCVDDY